MFQPVLVAVEPEDSCEAQTLQLYKSSIQQQEVNSMSFLKNLHFIALTARRRSETLSTL